MTSQVAGEMDSQAFAENSDAEAMERRLFLSMQLTVVLAVVISAAFAPWRVMTGLLLGGALSLLNHYWLRASIAAAFGSAAAGTRPRIRMASYVLRYFVIAGAVGLAYWLDAVSLVATLLGLCSFVVALLLEATRQIYLAIAYREE